MISIIFFDRQKVSFIKKAGKANPKSTRSKQGKAVGLNKKRGFSENKPPTTKLALEIGLYTFIRDVTIEISPFGIIPAQYKRELEVQCFSIC